MIGRCPLGSRCPFGHDPAKVAVCRDFLKHGECQQDQNCDLSHELTYERVPACVHFIRGTCFKSACRYPHVRVKPAAEICWAFSCFGFCSRGTSCPAQHRFECPGYFEEGKCLNAQCRLRHVDRAGQLRQHAVQAIQVYAKGKASNPSITDSTGTETLGDAIILEAGGLEDQALSRQEDFIQF